MNNDPARFIIIVLGDVASLQTHFVRLRSQDVKCTRNRLNCMIKLKDLQCSNSTVVQSCCTVVLVKSRTNKKKSQRAEDELAK